MKPEPVFLLNFRQFHTLTCNVDPSETRLKWKGWFHTGDSVFFIGFDENDSPATVILINGSGEPNISFNSDDRK